MLDAPYLVEKAQSIWRFALTYAGVDVFLPLAHQCLAASRLPYGERDAALLVSHCSGLLQPAQSAACHAL